MTKKPSYSEVGKIRSRDLYSYIRKKSNSTLTVEQIRLCFRIYSDLIKEIYSDPNVSDIVIQLPYLGKFYTTVYKGKKNGTKYKIRNLFTGVVEDRIAIDEPSYKMLKFSVNESVREMIKKKTSYVEREEECREDQT